MPRLRDYGPMNVCRFSCVGRLFAGGLALILFCVSPSYAQQLLVVDQKNKPLSNVVVVMVGTRASVEPEPVIVDQVDKQFMPMVSVTQRQQPVSFPNSDAVRHHVYSFSRQNAFELKLYEGAPPRMVYFEHAGIVVLGCNIHDHMIGYIYVSDGEIAVKTDEQGIAQLPVNPTGPLKLWHPHVPGGVKKGVTKTVEVTELAKRGWRVKLKVKPPKLKKRRDDFEYSLD